MFDVIIIGAGVVGGLIARKLSRYKLKILVVDKESDVSCGASKANSGIVHAGYDPVPGTLKALLNVRGSEMMETVAVELGVGYRRNGSMVLAYDDKELEILEKLLDRGKRNGVRDIGIIGTEDLHRIEPRIAKDAKYALDARTGAIICPYELAIASVGNAMDNGCELELDYEVRSISYTDGAYEISDGSRAFSARYIVNCSGVSSDIISSFVTSPRYKIIPKRGEYLLIDKEFGKTVDHTVFRVPTKAGKGILVSPTVDGNLLLGPTSETSDDRCDSSTTKNGLDYITGVVSEMITDPPVRSVITSFCGIRSSTDFGDFIIEMPVKGFVDVAGIDSPGLTSSPAIAEYVADILSQSGLELIEKQDFDPVRKPFDWFRKLSVEEKEETIKADPSYGQYICRCEGVSKGEIIEAIRRNPGAKDLDAVKRRTRSGMGRCQGGFCSPSVVSIISSELGIPYESVTKCGTGSEINFRKIK